jgi:uracil-DNA glycosylase
LITALLAQTPPAVFNPWREYDPNTDLSPDAPANRMERLRTHLAVDARYVFIGEAAGYQGCKVTGIAFTSERLVLEGRIPRIHLDAPRLTSRGRPWSEPSATTVWGTLHALGLAADAVLWNAYPWHPHRRGEPHSNRTPTRVERLAGLPVLRSLLNAYPKARVFAVGRNAQASLSELGAEAVTLRHPSMGGAMEFARQLRAAVGG